MAAHDAATAHLGSPWRMPTDAEFSALLDNCTTAWITTNGVPGQLFTGKGDYWSSTPISDIPSRAWCLCFVWQGGYAYFYDRCYGRSVRPVRDGE